MTVANRTRGRAEALARDLPGCALSEWDARVAALADHALVVNTTPLGMVGHEPLDLDLSRAPASLVVADNVYVPLETPLLARPAAVVFAAWKVSACCFTRRYPASTPGSALNRGWTRSFASSSSPTC